MKGTERHVMRTNVAVYIDALKKSSGFSLLAYAKTLVKTGKKARRTIRLKAIKNDLALC